MSLLLDALKKAAEQKARQADAESDKSGVDQIQEDISESDEVRSPDDTVIIDDKTEIVERQLHEDATEILTNHEATEVITNHEATEVLTNHDATEVLTNHNATEVLADEDATEIYDRIDSKVKQEDIQSQDDARAFVETVEIEAEKNTRDDTVVNSGSQVELTDKVVVDSSQPGEKDDTVRSDFKLDQASSVLSNSDVSDFMDGSSDDPAYESKEDGYIDEDNSNSDLSLQLLRELDDTTQNSKDDTVIGSSAHLEGLADYTDSESQRLANDESATRNSTITADQGESITGGVELESLRHEHTVMRPDATSTHTYAPDNYDRTLMRPPSDDASKIFAGMKADDDVLMTPDYAKRVFLSKSSANRLQHYKIYLGIAVSVLLTIAIYSMVELLDEYNRIDTAILPLKRDPLPGIIQKSPEQNETDLFANTVQPDVDTQTLKLVENAQTTVVDEQINHAEASDSSESSDEKAVSENQQLQKNPDKPVTNESEQTVRQVATRVELDKKPVKNIGATAKIKNTNAESTGSLQISSSNRLSKIDQWLADAFAAYQRGDDKTALQNYSRVLEEDPSNRNALLARAAIKVQNGNAKSAITDYQALILANPKDSLAMSSLISIARTTPQQSESQLKLMIRDEPDSPHLNFVLANVYGAQNRWQEAQSLYFRALQNKPEDPNYAYNLAVSLEHISKPKVAITYYEKAIANIRNGLATFDKDLVDNRIEMLKQL